MGKNQYRVKGLPVGEKMLFRVSAVNIAGRSPPATLTQAVTVREIMGQRHVFSYRHILNRSCCCCRETKRWHQYLCARWSLVNLTTVSLLLRTHRHIMFHIYIYVFTFSPPHRAPKDPPASPPENQTHLARGREGELGHPLPGKSKSG